MLIVRHEQPRNSWLLRVNPVTVRSGFSQMAPASRVLSCFPGHSGKLGVVSPLSSSRLRGPYNRFAHEKLADTMCADSLVNSSGCGSVSCRLTADTRPAAHCRNGRASGLQPRTACDHGLPLKPGGQSGSLAAVQARGASASQAVMLASRPCGRNSQRLGRRND